MGQFITCSLVLGGSGTSRNASGRRPQFSLGRRQRQDGWLRKSFFSVIPGILRLNVSSSLFVHSWLAQHGKPSQRQKARVASAQRCGERRAVAASKVPLRLRDMCVLSSTSSCSLRDDEGVCTGWAFDASSESKLVSQPVECSDCLYRCTCQTATGSRCPSVDQ